MPGAVIVIDQAAPPNGAGPGTPGVSRNDLWNGRQVTLHVGTTGNSSYQWDLIWAPVGSAAELDSPLTETCHFTPDMVGTYRFRLITNGGGADNVSILIARVRFSSTGVLENRGWAYPAFGEKDGENNYTTNTNSWAEIIEYIFEDIRLNGFGGGGSITLGGDLAPWIPTPGDDHQRVVGLNTVPIPDPELPVHGDMLRAEAQLLLSNSPFDITSDGTRVWVGDIFNPTQPSGGHSAYGGLVGVTFADETIDVRHDYPAGTFEAIPYDAIQIWSVTHLDGYIYATVLMDTDGPSLTPALFKIDPVTGSLVDGYPIHGMSYVRTDGTFLYLLEPHPGAFLPGFFWVDPSDLTTQTAIGVDHNPHVVGFAHDTTLGKVWLASGVDGDVMCVDAVTHAVDFTVNYGWPSGMAYSPGKIWLIVGSAAYGNYTPGYQYYGYSYYGDATDLLVLDPTSGVDIQAVTDPDGLILGALRMAYDSVNNKIWVLCDESDPCTGSPTVCYGPRLVRVDATTMAVDGWASLDVVFNMAITVAGGYVWVVDSPDGDPDGEVYYTILKIDPSIVVYPAQGEVAPGVIARITGGPVAYQFIRKNQDIVAASSEDSVYVALAHEVVLVALEGATVWLPENPVDGERHTIKDASGNAGQYGPIYVSTFDGGTLVATIATNYGSVTVIWSSSLGYWLVI